MSEERPRAWDVLVAWVRARDAARGHNHPPPQPENKEMAERSVTSPGDTSESQLKLL